MNTAALCIILAHSEAQRMSAHHAVLVFAVLFVPYRNAHGPLTRGGREGRRQASTTRPKGQLIGPEEAGLCCRPGGRSPGRTDRPPARGRLLAQGACQTET